jgi:hypothetical protein
MPQARKSTRSSSRRSSSFKEPAALKRLNQSLTTAQKALTDLRKHGSGSDAAAGTKTLYKGLSKFVSDARKDSTKFGTALRKDFEQAAKAAQQAAKTATGTGSARRSSSSTRSSSSRSGSSSSRSTSSRSSGTKSRSGGSSTRRSSSRSGSSRSTRKSS